MTTIGYLIKEFFEKYGEGSAYDVYKYIKRVRGKASYRHVINTFHYLEKLGYIRYKRSQPATSPRSKARLVDKKFYVLTEKGKREIEGWENPFRTLYPHLFGEG